MPNLTIYTDGGCDPNPGKGGWAAVFLGKIKGELKELKIATGKVESTTNNRMEMTAIIKSLEMINRKVDITIRTDSTYVIQGIGDWKNGKTTRKGWIINWQNNNWQRRGKPVLNKDLWKKLYKQAIRQQSVTFEFVKGHSGDHYNEMCDRLATEAIATPKLVVHCKKEKYDVYIGRPEKWQNPFVIGKHGNREEVIAKYEEWLTNGDGKHLLADLHELKGKVLGCWCDPKACHGNILAKLAND